jgi:hypothetical protein
MSTKYVRRFMECRENPFMALYNLGLVWIIVDENHRYQSFFVSLPYRI